MKSEHVLTRYGIVALVAALALFVSLFPILQVSQFALIADNVISGIVLSGLLYLFMFILKYGRYSTLLCTQRLVIFVVLMVLFILSWLIISLALTYLFLPFNEWNLLFSTIPMRVIFSIMVYSAVLFWANAFFHTKDILIEEEIIEDGLSDSDLIQNEDVETTDSYLEEIALIEHVAVKDGQKIDIIPISEIIHLQAEGDYVMIHSTKGRFLKEQTMKSFENQLPPSRFVRVHRSSIINIEYIAQIELYEKQNQLLKLKNGTQVKISLNGYKQLKKVLSL